MTVVYIVVGFLFGMAASGLLLMSRDERRADRAWCQRMSERNERAKR